jgi:hypothetical protein
MNSKIPVGAIVYGSSGTPCRLERYEEGNLIVSTSEGRLIRLASLSAVKSWTLPFEAKVWLTTAIETGEGHILPMGTCGIIQEQTDLGCRVLFGESSVIVLLSEIEAHPGLLKMYLPKPVAIADLELYGASLKTHGIINPQVGSIVRLHPGTGIIAEVEGTGFLCRIRVTDIEGYTDQRVVSRWFPLHGLSVLGMEITPQ